MTPRSVGLKSDIGDWLGKAGQRTSNLMPKALVYSNVKKHATVSALSLEAVRPVLPFGVFVGVSSDASDRLRP